MWKPDRFIIAGWGKIDDIEAYANDGYNFAIYLPTDQLDEFYSYGIIGTTDSGLPIGEILKRRNHPAHAGYYISDEPHYDNIQPIIDEVNRIKEYDPDHWFFSCLLPFVEGSGLEPTLKSQEPVTAYTNYATRCIKDLSMDILSFNQYPFKAPVVTPGWWLSALGISHLIARQMDIPFIPVTQFSNLSMPENFKIPTEVEARWLIYTALAYGAKGMIYFPYEGPNEEKARLNKEMYSIGKILFNEQCREISDLRQTIVGLNSTITKPTTVSAFTNGYFMVVNNCLDATIEPKIGEHTGTITRFDITTESWVEVTEEVIPVEPGAGILFRKE